MKKLIGIATPLIAAAWLIIMLLPSNNMCTLNSLGYFTDLCNGNIGFWAFLFSPFTALLFSAIATTTTLISSLNRSKSVFASVLWNGYLILQLLIHLSDVKGASGAVSYYVYTAVFGALYILTVLIHCYRMREETIQEKADRLEALQSNLNAKCALSEETEIPSLEELKQGEQASKDEVQTEL